MHLHTHVLITRTILAHRICQRCITGKATSDKNNSPKISCDKSKGVQKTSIREFQVTPEFDCDLEFHYTMPDGSTCKHRSSCKSSGTTVQNTQCGGATDVTIVYPHQPDKSKDSCDYGIHHIGFDCEGPKPTKQHTYPVNTPTYPVNTYPVNTPTYAVSSPSESVSTPATTPSFPPTSSGPFTFPSYTVSTSTPAESTPAESTPADLPPLNLLPPNPLLPKAPRLSLPRLNRHPLSLLLPSLRLLSPLRPSLLPLVAAQLPLCLLLRATP
ncbi:hypothetical protein F4679DRAFT_89911 [Xylaria curta]|nr:hypothetical protein F4679DRAFT_89911 [Xylaria curta]